MIDSYSCQSSFKFFDGLSPTRPYLDSKSRLLDLRLASHHWAKGSCVLSEESDKAIWSVRKRVSQCDHIERFLKVLGNKVVYKSSTKRLLTLGLFWKRSIKSKNCRGYYLGNLWKHLGKPNIWSHWGQLDWK